MWNKLPGTRACLLLAILAAASLISSCTEEPPPYLSAKDRELIDTLYVRQLRIVRPQLDSLCEAIYEEKVQRSVDSMLEIRRTEEARLRERIKVIQ